MLVEHDAAVEVAQDEQPTRALPEKIPHLKPAFKPDGTVTAANASSISDGAAALVLMRQSEAVQQGLTVRARLSSYGTHAQAPGWFTTAPIGAIRQALSRSDLAVSDIDLWEINEAFAVVPMAAAHELSKTERQPRSYRSFTPVVRTRAPCDTR